MRGVSKSISEAATIHPARDAALDAVHRATRRTPIRPATVQTAGLAPRDRGFAEAVYRTVMQRWLTINWVLDRVLDKPRIEPALRAVLAAGAGQLLFMEQPAHAVVDTAVEQAKAFVRPGAGPLVNAVLRRTGEMIVDRGQGDWSPANNTVPLAGGVGWLKLSRQAMLKPRRLDRYLSVATSHDEQLVAAWRQRWGDERAIEMLLHGTGEPPTMLRTPQGYVPWTGRHDELLERVARPDCWVQDATAGKAVDSLTGSAPAFIIDYCAGRGTKTKQLADRFSDARIIATDPDADRFADLRAAFGGHDRVRVLPTDRLSGLPQPADLLLLDVPCSNTGVLARRPEAKYRYAPAAIESLIALQRQIVEQAAPLLAPGGMLLYSTCSVEPSENEQQAAWIAERLNRSVLRESLTLPGGRGEGHHDGGFYAAVGRDPAVVGGLNARRSA